jgi:DNA polymerase-3 subunit gamma/tau
LRERVGYAPAEGRWKVYILDEAHMLTKEAWNAFLKTLEEPPPNTVFVLATTEPQKVMATIVDRCQRFDFQRPSLDQIAEVVRRVASAEGIEVEDGAVALTARAASGSFRDALGTLDQLVAFGGERITTGDVVEMLGAADAELLFDVTDALAAGDAAATLEAVERLSRSGRDPGQFARDLIGHLRQLLVTRATGEVPESFTVTVAQPERLAEQAERVDDAKLMGAIDALSTAVANMREGDDPRLSLEVALLKVARPTLDSSREALLRRIESLERKLGSSESQGPASASPRSASQPGTPGGEAEDLPVDESGASASPRTASQPGTRGSEAEDVPIDPSGASASSAAASQAAAPGSEAEDLPVGGEAVNQNPQPNPEAEPHVNLEDVAHLWPAVVDHVRGSGSEMLSTLFEGARPLGVDAERGTLRIGFPPSAKFNKRKAESKPNVERIAESVDAIVGERLRPVYELLDADESEPAEANGAPAMEEEEIIELLKTKFDASEVVGDEGRDEGTG